MAHVYVAIEPDEDGYPPYKTEEIDAVEVDPGRYRIEAVPVLARGLARGDLVKVVRVVGDARLWVADVVEESGHWTARVIPASVNDLASVAQSFTDIGCLAYSTPFGLVAVDVPSEVEQGRVMQTLTRGRDEGIWDFDMGVTPR